jgi:acyl dehydratase
MRELESSPALLPLYVKASLPRTLRDEVPGEALRIKGLRPSTGHVADYAKLCGFTLASSLPLTYPHVLGFPLQLALMADRRFPFPATGLVHISNAVESPRAVPVGAAVDVSVRAVGPRPHPKGRTVDMLTSVAMDGENVWSSTSTYLRRGTGSGKAAADAARPIGVPTDLATTSVWKLPGSLGRRYAAVSGDRNPIHLSSLTARPFGFSRPIAHGMWMSAACLAALEGRLSDALRYDVEFKAAVPLPSTVELATRVTHGGSADVVLRSARSSRPHLVGRITPLSRS